jgi:hypothetical protein
MSFPARYSDTFEVERGYEDIAKAVFQIWRYVAHCRLGTASDTLTDNCVGVVLIGADVPDLTRCIRRKYDAGVRA